MIGEHLIQNGILQVGLFVTDTGHTMPYRLRLEMLPAYPGLLEELSRQATQFIADMTFDRIVADYDVMALGVLLSVGTGIPLVYSQGRGAAPVHDLVGAYDVGHPAILFIGEYSAATSQLIRNCQRVGLQIEQVVALVGHEDQIGDISVKPLVDFGMMLEELTEKGLLPKPQAEAILAHQG